jgi:hypothetical protein
MTLEDAKVWKGEAYSALFVLGLPLSLVEPENDPMVIRRRCTQVQLSTEEVMYGDVVQDANESDIEVARATLITAVFEEVMYGDVVQDANESDIEVARATLNTAESHDWNQQCKRRYAIKARPLASQSDFVRDKMNNSGARSS